MEKAEETVKFYMHAFFFPCSYSPISDSFTMSLTGQTLRSSPYALPQPGAAAGRLATVSRQGGGYSGPSFSSHLQHHYNYTPQTSQTGFSFQNSVLFPGSQGSGVLPPPPPPPPPATVQPSSSSSMLPDSPVSHAHQWGTASISKCSA